MTPVKKFLDLVNTVKAPNLSMEGVVRRAASIQPALALRVMEEIGSFPSSEPELAILQRVFP